jgi:hypothetical protein
MGLHSKSLVMDRRFAVIGSANLDPRSAFLNSEMIAIIDSKSLAEELAQAILLDTSAANSWEVSLNEKDQIIWSNDVESVSRQPARNGWQRFQDLLFMLFPKRLYYKGGVLIAEAHRTRSPAEPLDRSKEKSIVDCFSRRRYLAVALADSSK